MWCHYCWWRPPRELQTRKCTGGGATPWITASGTPCRTSMRGTSCPHFFAKGLKINAEKYVRVLRDVAKNQRNNVAADHSYSFQWDGALRPRLGPKSQFWPKYFNPTSSPDCNPLDYYAWSACEQDGRKFPDTTASLMATSRKLWSTSWRVPWPTPAKGSKAGSKPWRRRATVLKIDHLTYTREHHC